MLPVYNPSTEEVKNRQVPGVYWLGSLANGEL